MGYSLARRVTIILYDFEGQLDLATLERPPLCALRALRVSGFLLTREGWARTPHEQRLKLCLAGSQPDVDVASVSGALKFTSPRELKMFSRLNEPAKDVVPESVQGALGPGRSVPVPVWAGLRPLDRHVLAMLGSNTRLLWRALDEMGASIQTASGHPAHVSWTGEVAHVEVHMRVEAAHKLLSMSLHSGHALVLARASGIRAARRAAELMDLHAHVITGPVELGFRTDYDSLPACVLCQAHASAVDGEFFPAGSLLAAVAAAATLADLVRDTDPAAVIQKGWIVKGPWLVGDDEETTIGM